MKIGVFTPRPLINRRGPKRISLTRSQQASSPSSEQSPIKFPFDEAMRRVLKERGFYSSWSHKKESPPQSGKQCARCLQKEINISIGPNRFILSISAWWMDTPNFDHQMSFFIDLRDHNFSIQDLKKIMDEYFKGLNMVFHPVEQRDLPQDKTPYLRFEISDSNREYSGWIQKMVNFLELCDLIPDKTF